jgi:hypothetical protein
MEKFDYLKELLDSHIIADGKKFDSINETLKLIKENHLTHIEKAMNSIENSHIKLETNTDWLLKFFWIIAGTSVGGLITSLFNLITK